MGKASTLNKSTGNVTFDLPYILDKMKVVLRLHVCHKRLLLSRVGHYQPTSTVQLSCWICIQEIGRAHV